MSLGPVTHPSVPQEAAETRAPSLELVRLGQSSTPLLEQAREASKVLVAGLGRAGDTVAIARLEAATLDFARGVRALHIGCPDISSNDREAAVEAALAAGEQQATAMPSVGLDAVDRFVTVLDIATQMLGEPLAPALYQPTATNEET